MKKKYVFATIDNADFVEKRDDIYVKCKVFEEDFSSLPKFTRFNACDMKAIYIKDSYYTAKTDGLSMRDPINISDFPNYKAIYKANKIKLQDCSVLSFDKEIILDEQGRFYLLTLADVNIGGCGPEDSVKPYYFVVKLNDEQANLLKNKTNIVANFIDDECNGALEDLYCFFSIISEELFDSMDIIDEEFIGKIYVYLNELK